MIRIDRISLKAVLLTYALLFFLFSPVIAEDPPSELTSDEEVKEIVIINKPDIPRSQKEALIILPGAGDSNRGRRKQADFFGKAGYDLYIPDYFDRKSLPGTPEKLREFYEEMGLAEYRKVHVFSYIIGSWVINEYINRYGAGNIASIVYDRSPLQERAPMLMAEKLRLVAKIAVGNILLDLSKTPYPPIDKGDLKIGIVVESKATFLIKMFRKHAMSYGEIDWHKLDFGQEHDDLIFTWLDHRKMYLRFDVVGDEVLAFIRNGSFPEDSRREPYEWDVFEKYREGKQSE